MMKTRSNNRKLAAVLSLAVALFALVGVLFHGCGVTEYGEITLKRIVLTPAGNSVYSGATVAFKAEGIYSDTTKRDITSKVTWQSSGEEVTIDPATGLATAGTVTSSYTCTIIATHADGISGKTTLTVKVPAFTSIVISAPGGAIAKDTSVQFTAMGSLDDGSTQDLTTKVAWASSAPTIVDIDGSGKATGKAGGSADITATYGALTSNSVTVVVSDVSLASLTIQVAAGGGTTITQGETAQFAATGTFSDASIQDMTPSVTWSSSNTAVAAFGASSGLALAQNQDGTTDITATFGAITSNAVTLTVSGPALQSIAIISEPYFKDRTKSIAATATYADASTADVSASVVWTSSDESIAVVVDLSGGGKGVQGLNTGSVTITASLKGKTASETFMLTEPGPYD
jgi:hypothetical protein